MKAALDAAAVHYMARRVLATDPSTSPGSSPEQSGPVGTVSTAIVVPQPISPPKAVTTGSTSSPEDMMADFNNVSISVPIMATPTTTPPNLSDDAIVASTPLIRQPRATWDDASMCYFLGEYRVAPQPGIIIGHMDFLSDMLFEAPLDSALRPATLATACLCFSRRRDSLELYAQSRDHYGKALKAVITSIEKGPDHWGDDTLASIMLLHMFEDIDSGHSHNATSHLKGIARLYDLRGQNLLSKIPGSPLYGWIFTHLQTLSLATNEFFECLSIPQPERAVTDPAGGLVYMVAKISRFITLSAERQSALDKANAPSEARRTALMTMMHLAMRTQSETDAWAESLPKTWKPRVVFALDESGNTRRLVTYSCRWLSVVSTMYHASLVKYYHTVLSCCQSILELHVSPTPAEKDLINATANMANKNLAHLIAMICDSLPYAFGEVDGDGELLPAPDYKGYSSYSLIWSLELVSTYPGSTKEQIALCKSSLTRIGSLYGIRLAQSPQNLAAFTFF
ncbi:hypothetical protein Sste5346_007273 [Sporothrix stenoceras]|uniref:C6 zinc finger domain containing protein n=1 Tax=Sporothrix stenoceras TaxID=5173 RepID=A0ABR3YUQ5_9PEZI